MTVTTNSRKTGILISDHLEGLVEQDSAAAATVNTEIIQAALDAGGTVSIKGAGTYHINSTLVLGSYTNLVLGPDVTIRQLSGTNSNMLVTATYQQVATAVTLTWSSGTDVSVAWTAHGKQIGDYVVIDCATTSVEQSKFKGVWRVASVTDANNFTYNTILLPSTAPTGSWTVKDATVSSSVIGGTWDYNATGNDGASTITTHCMLLVGTANCTFRPGRFYDLLKFGLCINGDSGSRAEESVCDSINSTGGDLVKVYGPAYGTVVRDMRGRSADDMVSVQPKEPAAYIGYMAMYGDCIGVKVVDVYGAKTTNTTVGVAFYASENETFKGCTIDGVHGVYSGQAVKIVAGEQLAATIFDAEVSRITANCTNAINITGGTGTLRFGTVTLSNCTHNPSLITGNFFSLSGSATGNVMNVERCKSEIDSLTTPTWPTGSAAVFMQLDGTLNLLNMSGCDMSGVLANARFSQLSNGSSIRQINIKGCRLSGHQGVNIQASPAIAPNILYEGCDLTLTYGVNAAASANVVAVGNSLNSATVLVNHSAGTVNLAHGGNVLGGTSALTAGTVTATAW